MVVGVASSLFVEDDFFVVDDDVISLLTVASLPSVNNPYCRMIMMGHGVIGAAVIDSIPTDRSLAGDEREVI